MTTDWTNFFLAQLGASASLLGFLFVGVSVNLKKIISTTVLDNFALIGVYLLLAIITVSSLMLLPTLSITMHGYFVSGVGIIIWGVATGKTIGDFRRAKGEARLSRAIKLAIYQVVTVPYLVAAPILLNGSGAGYYWLAAAIILSTILAVTDA